MLGSVQASARERSTSWLLSNSHRWDAWTIEHLVQAKHTTGQRVSLVVPARNEAATVGTIITRIRDALMDTTALVDEVLVIDSDSSDRTFSTAQDAGAKTYRSSEIRPDLGTYPGKGEAMWKSQFVSSGDIVVFMDADLVEWDTHFVPGLLGPLLTRDDIVLVKGFYTRPYAEGTTEHTLEGGRVTELVARPLIALRFPDLAGVIQPLAGEWAIRRSHFASLPVPTGYGVEFAVLADTAAQRGLDVIAQVDLGHRGHRHHGLLDLGLMATQVMGAAQRRIATSSIDMPAECVDVLQFRPHDGPGTTTSERRSVALNERPPAQTLWRQA